MTTRFTTILAAAFLALAPLPALADMKEHLGLLSGIVKLGQDGKWRLEDKGGWFTMTNTDAPGAVRYFWVEVPDRHGPDYVISTSLVAQNDIGERQSFAGLVFDFKDKENYMAVAIGTGGGGYVFTRRPKGFSPIAASDVKARNDGSDVLRAHVTGDRVRFELNGEELFSMQTPDSFARTAGVMAIGQGTFGFTGFSIYSE